VDKLVLSSYPYWRYENERVAASKEAISKRLEINQDGWHLMEWWQRAKRYEDPVEIVDEITLGFHKAGLRGEELDWATHAYDTKLKLPLIKCPTLVLSGTRDFFCAVVQDVKSLIPRSKITVIKNGPVFIDRVMPKDFAEAILAFLKDPGV
jgi:pimeloyl-ACP methyl ester carboxylesterase